MINNTEYSNKIETLISLFTIEKGIVKVLLSRKKSEPYKGYWILPGELLSNGETFESNVEHVLFDKIGLSNIHIEQTHTYSNLDRVPDERIIAINFMGLIDSKSSDIKRVNRATYETEWFSIDAVPKMAFDYNIIIAEAINYLRQKIVNSNVLKSLFPSDFTLPEIQSVYENILNRKLDRRNFRKKFINLGLIEDTGDKNEAANGRPAKLYRFKDDIKIKNLF